MPIRPYSPYDGKRYLLNLNTCEIHDLQNEQTNCQIDEIKESHVSMYDTYEEAEISGIFNCHVQKPNGCRWCLPGKHID